MADFEQDLQDAVDRIGQAEVARRMQCSAATVSKLRQGTYPAPTGKWEHRFRAVFQPSEVACPVLGAISSERCAHLRGLDFAPTNPTRVQLFQTCPTCPHNPESDTATP